MQAETWIENSNQVSPTNANLKWDAVAMNSVLKDIKSEVQGGCKPMETQGIRKVPEPDL